MDFSILAQAAGDVEISYGKILLTGGGNIGYLLWLMSVVVVGLSVHYIISIRRLNILPDMIRMQLEELFEGKQYREAIDLTEGQSDFLSYTVHAALTEAPHGYPAMERAMEEAAEERTTKMLRSIEWLSLMGNIGPMLGLLGTVWGMIGAFFTIANQTGSPNPGELAGDIGIALVTTLLGLGVSIPSLSVYSIMRNRIDAMTSESIMVSQELISNFRPTAKR
ncbi:MAG: MotA/TolQ/ExbB proton channel family protein [Phycisphaerae bacterium]|nr:MotA/TolQ/ExbB proton channel family protein [Phycisphaerae bacterium]